MLRRIAFVIGCVASSTLIIASCSKDEVPTTNQPPNTLNASATSVSVTSGQTQNVTISGGTPAYAIATQPDSRYATARLDSASNSTATLVIIGAVTTATGSTPVVVRDASSPTRQATITIMKQ